MRFTHDGILVNSGAVWLVSVIAVLLTTGASVSVTATNVCVLDPATAGADTVIEPDVSPDRTKEAMIYPLSNHNPA